MMNNDLRIEFPMYLLINIVIFFMRISGLVLYVNQNYSYFRVSAGFIRVALRA
jgi:hypothetical protein